MDINLVKSFSALGAALAIGVGAFGAALAMGQIGKATLEGITRQPETTGTSFTTMLIACALVESLAIYCLLISLILLAANPLLK